MAGSSKSNPPRPRKRVNAEANTLKRARDGSAFTKCEECNKDVPVVLIDMHSCSLDSKIKMHLESQIVEKVSDANKPVKRRKAAAASSSEKRVRKGKKEKDPNMPKRPPTGFFIFMDDFRKEFKAANPDSKGVTKVTKEGGERWKSMTNDEKKPYLDKAAEKKADYEKAMEKFNAENEEEDEGEDGEGLQDREDEELQDKEEIEDKE